MWEREWNPATVLKKLYIPQKFIFKWTYCLLKQREEKWSRVMIWAKSIHFHQANRTAHLFPALFIFTTCLSFVAFFLDDQQSSSLFFSACHLASHCLSKAFTVLIPLSILFPFFLWLFSHFSSKLTVSLYTCISLFSSLSASHWTLWTSLYSFISDLSAMCNSPRFCFSLSIPWSVPWGV